MNLFPIIRTWLLSNSWIQSFVYFYQANYNGNEEPNGSGSLSKKAFSRSNTAEDGTKSGSVRFDGQKYVELIANEPRITKLNNHTFNCDVLALLPEKKNLIPYSRENVSTWTEFKPLSSSVTFTANSGIDTFGEEKALGVYETTGTGTKNFYIDNLGGITSGDNTFGFAVKSIGGRNIRFDEGAVGFNAEGIVDLETGEILQDVHGNIEVYAMPNDWWYIQVSGNNAGTSQRIIFNIADGTNFSINGDTSKGVLITDLIYVSGDFTGVPLMPIPTYGSALTRQLDGSIYMDVAGATSIIYGQLVNFSLLGNGGSHWVLGLRDSGGLVAYLRWTNVDGSAYNFYNQENTATLASGSWDLSVANAGGKFALVIRNSTIEFWLNGIEVFSTSIPNSWGDITDMYLDAQSSAFGGLNGRSEQYWKELGTGPLPASDDEIIQVTTWDDFDTMATELNFS